MPQYAAFQPVKGHVPQRGTWPLAYRFAAFYNQCCLWFADIHKRMKRQFGIRLIYL
jgi:hypothetical protein